ncbi:MAG TPA: hypothetical protein VFE37_17965 [Chloroflexota bacterium]|nr:hypothetical protein [Chloroflexota bacterium]
MTDMLMLLVSLLGFGGLVIGWMALPDSSKSESAPVATATRVAEAA